MLQSLWEHDPFLVCADFDDYVACQERIDAAYRDADAWTRMVVHNLAGVGWFSSDRSIRQYAEEIWGVQPVDVELGPYVPPEPP